MFTILFRYRGIELNPFSKSVEHAPESYLILNMLLIFMKLVVREKLTSENDIDIKIWQYHRPEHVFHEVCFTLYSRIEDILQDVF